MITLRSSVPFFFYLLEPSALVSRASFLQLFDGFREVAASTVHRLPECLGRGIGIVSCACFALGSFVDVLVVTVTLLHPIPRGGMRGHARAFVA